MKQLAKLLVSYFNNESQLYDLLGLKFSSFHWRSRKKWIRFEFIQSFKYTFYELYLSSEGLFKF